MKQRFAVVLIVGCLGLPGCWFQANTPPRAASGKTADRDIQSTTATTSAPTNPHSEVAKTPATHPASADKQASQQTPFDQLDNALKEDSRRINQVFQEDANLQASLFQPPMPPGMFGPTGPGVPNGPPPWIPFGWAEYSDLLHKYYDGRSQIEEMRKAALASLQTTRDLITQAKELSRLTAQQQDQLRVLVERHPFRGQMFPQEQH